MATATAVAFAPDKQEDERKKFGALYAKYYPKLMGLCCSMLSDLTEAEDATQTTFLSAWEKRNSFRGDSKFSTWVYRIAINVCLTKRRHDKIYPTDQFDLITDDEGESVDAQIMLPSRSASPFQLVARKQVWEYFHGLIADVPDLSRRNVLLHHIEDLDHAEIAALTGVGLAATKTRTFRGRERLRKEFRSVGYYSWRDIL